MLETFQGGLLHKHCHTATHTFLGDQLKVLISDKETGGAYALTEFAIRKDSGAPPHLHTHEDEFFYLLEGTLEFTVAGKTILATKGDFVHVYKGDIHSFRNPNEQIARVLIGMTPGRFVNFFLELAQPIGDSQAPPTMPAIESLVAMAAKYGCTILLPQEA